MAVFHTGFASVCGDCLCPAGAKGYYELQVVVEPSAPRWGFCSGEWARTEEHEWVGHDKESWGVDGDRVLKWHSGDQGPFGRTWCKGDVIGLACELPPITFSGGCGCGGRILVSVNGDFSPPNGAAFDLPADLFGLHPAFTCLAGAVRCNLGGDPARPLRHAPPATDYRAMATFLPARAPDEPPVPH